MHAYISQKPNSNMKYTFLSALANRLIRAQLKGIIGHVSDSQMTKGTPVDTEDVGINDIYRWRVIHPLTTSKAAINGNDWPCVYIIITRQL